MAEVLQRTPPAREPSKFALQMDEFPELRDEVTRLSDGSIRVTQVILIKMNEAIEQDPDRDVSIEQMHEVLGIPKDAATLDQWRNDLWAAWRAELEACL